MASWIHFPCFSISRIVFLLSISSVESSAMCNVTALEFFTPGQLCITLNQTRALINNPLGSWRLLLGIYIKKSA